MDGFVCLLLALGIAFAAYIPKISSVTLIAAFIICIPTLKKNNWLDKRAWFVVLAFLSPTLAVLFSSSLRGEFTARDFDAASRTLLGIPIFLYLLSTKIRTTKFLSIGVFTALFLGWFFIDPERTNFYGDRYATGYSDVNSLGAIMVSFITIATSTLLFYKIKNAAVVLTMLVGIYLGVHLLINTGARGPILVLAAVMIAIFVLAYSTKRISASPRIVGVLASVILFPVILIATHQNLKNRVISIGTEVANLIKNPGASETSSDIRVSMLKLSSYMFLERPLAGWGDIRKNPEVNQEALGTHAKPIVLETIKLGGPHNTIAARSIESGIWGLASVLALHFLPLSPLFRKENGCNHQSNATRLAITFTLSIFCLGFTLDTFTMKYMTSLNTILLVMVLSEAYKERYHVNKNL